MEASALRRPGAGLLPRSRRLLAAFSDDKLVDQIRRGNSAAFEVVYERHYRGILSFCRHMLGSREEAEDAVQQTFASSFGDLQSNDRPIRLKAWLYTIARNRCLSILRARREQAAELEDLPAFAGLSDQVQQRADLRELLHDMRELPHEQREALVLCELGDLSQAEVAGVIGVEPMKVKALVFQARSALIENREARAIPCREIREQLATATGGALRRGPLKRHLKACDGCREYRDQVRAQRSALAIVLPVVPTLGLKESVLAGLGFGGGAGGAGAAAGGAGGAGAAGVAGGTAGGGGLLSVMSGAGAAKLAIGAAMSVGAVAGGGIAIERAVDGGGGDSSAQAAEAQRASSSGSSGTGATPAGDPGGGSATPVAAGGQGKRESGSGGDERAETTAKAKAKTRTAAERRRAKRRRAREKREANDERRGVDATGEDNGNKTRKQKRNRGRGKARGRRGANHQGSNGGRSRGRKPRPPRPQNGNSGSGSQQTPQRPPKADTEDNSGGGNVGTRTKRPPKATAPNTGGGDDDDGAKGDNDKQGDDADRLLPTAVPVPE